MSKLLLLYLTFVIGLVFLFVPMKQEMIDFFPLSDFKIYPVNYVYYICEKLIVIILAYVIAEESEKYRNELFIFLVLCIADMADYLLSYSSIWFHMGSIPVSMNTVKCFIFGLVILNAWIRTLLK